MELATGTNIQWNSFKELYQEAFPKRERKPFFTLQRSIRRGKAQLMTATEGNDLLGFAVLIPYLDMVMVDYLAVSSRLRSRGTGSRIMEKVGEQFSDRRTVLLIERLDDNAKNQDQRIARRKFYMKNGFSSSGIFTKGAGGDMEILTRGGDISSEEYLSLQKHALGSLFFSLSRISLVS